ncbi:hypothetical protein DPMN_017027 [Dreissena polymorpha]|uniref:Uncharacterized protein n=1 Tax=Dreissena polymorpha TaxID=45954 RepID=A0A9D4NAQ4_DREPO|nr:hypothetical protein DPMN_017027 [Dreissena polymorpha]
MIEHTVHKGRHGHMVPGLVNQLADHRRSHILAPDFLRPQLPEWELPLVVSMLEKSLSEPLGKTSLKYVTYKAVFLTAITTFRIAGDLQVLRLGEGSVSVQAKGLTFLRHGLS